MPRGLRVALVCALAIGAAVATPASARPNPARDARLEPADARREGVAQKKGRYKKEGDNCVWSEEDSGPNQCEPRIKGRFKKEGDRCAWTFNEEGPDQCRPAKGRWKQEGKNCVWTADDSGPNQCNPRQPR